MYIVGLTGPINHGKTTTAKLLMSQEPYSKLIESWQVIAEVAERLNQNFDQTMVSSSDLTSVNSWLFHLLDILPGVVNARPTFDMIEIREHEIDAKPDEFNKLFVYIDRLKDNPGLASEEITYSNKEDHRPILQWLGGYLSSTMGESIWFNEIMHRVAAADEKTKLFVIAGLRFPADAERVRHHGGKIIEVYRPGHEVRDQADPTELNRNLIEADTKILNNGSIQDLEDAVKALWVDMKAEKLRYEYSAVN
jgi:hypothetical protein